MHAPVSLAAMDLGKHVYCEKPLTWSIDESRQMARVAREKKLATQMGTQGMASEQRTGRDRGGPVRSAWRREGAARLDGPTGWLVVAGH